MTVLNFIEKYNFREIGINEDHDSKIIRIRINMNNWIDLGVYDYCEKKTTIEQISQYIKEEILLSEIKWMDQNKDDLIVLHIGNEE